MFLSLAICHSSRLTNHLRTLLANGKKGGTAASDPRILVFVLYKKEASRVEQSLQRLGYKVAAIHGDMGQQARIAALEEFKQGKVKLLVATDVAARGLDIPNVGTVLNYSFPLTIGASELLRCMLASLTQSRGLHPPHRPHWARRRLGQIDHVFHGRSARKGAGGRAHARPARRGL